MKDLDPLTTLAHTITQTLEQGAQALIEQRSGYPARNHPSRQRPRTIRPRLRTLHVPTHRTPRHPQQSTTTTTQTTTHRSNHNPTRRWLHQLRTSRHMDRTNSEQPHVPHLHRARPPHPDAMQHHTRTTTNNTRRQTTPRPTHHNKRNQRSNPPKENPEITLTITTNPCNANGSLTTPSLSTGD